MLNIQAQPQVSPQQQVNFKGREDEGYERRYVSTDDDYDNYDRTPSRTIRGCNPNDEYDMKHKRF